MRTNKTTKSSRRNFVKTSTLLTGGILTIPPSLKVFSMPKSDTVLKIALIGCGGRGSGALVNALQADENVKLVAMADAFQDRIDSSLKGINDHFDGEKTIELSKEFQFTGFNAYKKAIDLADVVLLATPPGFRPTHFDYAVKQNKHVFMEKPLATDPVGVKRILDSNKEAMNKKLNVVVGLQRHYSNKYLDLYSRVQDGLIGKIISGQVYWNSAGVWVYERKEGQSELEYQMRNWYYFNWLCGDHIVEQHIHNIDIANWFIGEHPLTAQGMGGRQVRNGKDHGEIYDHHFVEFTYPGGAVISSQCRHIPGCMNRVDEVLQGTKGTVFFGQGLVKDLNGKKIYQYQGSNDPNPYQVEQNELFKAIRNGNVINDVDYAAHSTLSSIAGRMATYSGSVIELKKALALDYQLVPDALDWGSTPPVLPDEDGNYLIAKPGETSYF
ncbi:MAG: Gfo/Idh/MocA family oxidoreductase [Flavobacteriaceae bacterium]|nr:Gfo/Idh/MocA family oxidoreductase [Flavobacteriaceae bacterium]